MRNYSDGDEDEDRVNDENTNLLKIVINTTINDRHRLVKHVFNWSRSLLWVPIIFQINFLHLTRNSA